MLGQLAARWNVRPSSLLKDFRSFCIDLDILRAQRGWAEFEAALKEEREAAQAATAQVAAIRQQIATDPYRNNPYG